MSKLGKTLLDTYPRVAREPSEEALTKAALAARVYMQGAHYLQAPLETAAVHAYDLPENKYVLLADATELMYQGLGKAVRLVRGGRHGSMKHGQAFPYLDNVINQAFQDYNEDAGTHDRPKIEVKPAPHTDATLYYRLARQAPDSIKLQNLMGGTLLDPLFTAQAQERVGDIRAQASDRLYNIPRELNP